MNNQAEQPTNPPIENPVPQTVTPPPSKSFLSNKIILPIVILLIILGLGGTYLALNSKPKSQPIVSKTIPTSTPTPTSITKKTVCRKLSNQEIFDPKNWTDYYNRVIGISFKYPKYGIVHDFKVAKGKYAYLYQYQLDEGTEIVIYGVCLADKDPNITDLIEGLDIQIFPVTTQGKLLYDVANELSGKGEPTGIVSCCKRVSLEPFLLGGLEAYKAKFVYIVDSRNQPIKNGKPTDYEMIFFEKSGKTYQMQIQYPGEYTQSYQKIYNQILSAFTFTDQTIDTSSWKTYTNKTHHYTVKYPEGWIAEQAASGAGPEPIWIVPESRPTVFDLVVGLLVRIDQPGSSTICKGSEEVSVDNIKGFKEKKNVSGETVELKDANGNIVPKRKYSYSTINACVVKNGSIYGFYFTDKDYSKEPIFDQILSTFNFL